MYISWFHFEQDGVPACLQGHKQLPEQNRGADPKLPAGKWPISALVASGQWSGSFLPRPDWLNEVEEDPRADSGATGGQSSKLPTVVCRTQCGTESPPPVSLSCRCGS
jgi:hypothetical protein